ncbi:MAG: 50S ribosomal protein L29 [Alphaproteobacteria bacterium]|nr:50S ribosomal protein L29 [Alphaproteobacteria bacterium]
MLKKEDILKIKSLSADELYKKRDELKKELMQLRFKKNAGQLETLHHIKQVRRDIARIETELSAKAKKETK